MTDGSVDQRARDDAREALHQVRNHIAVSEIQFKTLERKIDDTHADLARSVEHKHADTTEKIGRVESALKWAGGLIVSLVITVLGWSVVQQINANEAQKQEMQRQIVLLQQQEKARLLHEEERLHARATEAASAALGR